MTRVFGSITDLEGLIGDDKEYSSTEIRSYLECPYKWFYTQRIRPKSIDNDFGPVARGNVLHGALELFYTRFTGENNETPMRVTAENLPYALEVLEPCVDDYLAGARKENLPTERQSALVEKCRQSLRAFISSEAEFLPGYEPSAFEVKFGRAADAAVRYGDLWVKGKVDRIDRDSGRGLLVVTDYKSGSVSQYKMNYEGNKFNPQVQVALYASVIETMTGERTVASLYRSIRRIGEQGGAFDVAEFADPQAAGLDAGCAVSDYRAYLNDVEEYVAKGMSRLLDGDLAPHPWSRDVADSPCRFCPLCSFCPGATMRGGAFASVEPQEIPASNDADRTFNMRPYLEAAVQALANPLDEASFEMMLVSPLFNMSDELLFKIRRTREEHRDIDSAFCALGALAKEDDEASSIMARYGESARIRREGDMAAALELLLGDEKMNTQAQELISQIREMQDTGATPYVVAYKFRHREADDSR